MSCHRSSVPGTKALVNGATAGTNLNLWDAELISWLQTGWEESLRELVELLLIEEILQQLIGVGHPIIFKGFYTSQVVSRISSINSISDEYKQ